MNKSEINKLINDYLEYLEVEKNSSKLTIRNYKHYLNRFWDWLNKYKRSLKMEDIEMADVRRFRLYLSRLTDRFGNRLSLSTQSYHVIALRSFLKWAARNDLDVLSAEKIDLPKTESRSLKFLNEAQIDRLLSMPRISDERGLRDRAILELLYSTGLRVSEIVKLNREKIDFKTKEFGIIGKGRRARVVFVSDRAAKWLKKYFESREDDWKPAFIRYARGKDAMQEGGEDMRLTVRSVQRVVEKYRRRAKLSVDITPHGLRHTFATDLLSHGAGLREVQEMLGHKNVSTTQIYTHVTNPQLKKVHEKFHSGNKAG